VHHCKRRTGFRSVSRTAHRVRRLGLDYMALEPDAEGDTHDSFPGKAARCVTKTVLVFGPPVAVYVFLADLASGPAAVDLHSFLIVKSLHDNFSFFFTFLFN